MIVVGFHIVKHLYLFIIEIQFVILHPHIDYGCLFN